MVITLSCARLKKCCPEGEIVQLDYFEDIELLPRKQLSCIEERVGRIKPEDSVQQMFSLNILIDENSHWPDACGNESDLLISILSESLNASQSASCVDILNNNFHLFTCNESLDTVTDFVNIFKFQKCCDKNSAYDVFAKSCIANNHSFVNPESFKFLGDKIATFETGLPDCEPQEILVEYNSMSHKLEIIDGYLIVPATNNLGSNLMTPHKLFCIESITRNLDVLSPDEQQNQAWIAKVCRSKTVCDEIPCVRKCCNEGLRLVTENETIYCEPHETHLDLKFHRFNIVASYKNPDTMVPTGERN